MNRVEEFKNLPKEDRAALIQPQLDLYTAAVGKKASVSPQIATIAAALIAITTINPGIVSLNQNEVKTLLSIFFLLIPISLFMYVWEQRKAAENSLSIIGSYQGKTLEQMNMEFNSQFKWHVNIFNWTWSRKEEGMISLVFIVIVYVLIRMWGINF